MDRTLATTYQQAMDTLLAGPLTPAQHAAVFLPGRSDAEGKRTVGVRIAGTARTSYIGSTSCHSWRPRGAAGGRDAGAVGSILAGGSHPDAQ